MTIEHRAAGEDYGAGNPAIPGRTHCPAADPVNCTTGNFYEQLADLTVGGRGPGLVASRAYNAAEAPSQSGRGESRLGPGWTHAYAQRLEIGSIGVVLHGTNGATASFVRQPDGSFTAGRTRQGAPDARHDGHVRADLP